MFLISASFCFYQDFLLTSKGAVVCVGVGVAPSTNSKMPPSPADDLQRLRLGEERKGANKIGRKHKGWISEYMKISFAKRRLPAAII